jgi:small subunit ribosomal protein S3
MGRKVHPTGFRLGYIKDWQSRWYADKNYAELLNEDRHIRELVQKELEGAGVSRTEIERAANKVEVTIHTAKPGVVIGKRGQNVDVLKGKLEKLTGKKIKLNISEIHQPELDAQLVAESIGEQITKRVSFRRAMRQAMQRATRLGAQGIRIQCSGRLNGAEMARTIWDADGRIPRHTLRADVDYAVVHAHTTYGRIGVKVWIYKGEVFPNADGTLTRAEAPKRQAQPADEGRGRDRGRNDSGGRGGRGGGGGGRGGGGGGGGRGGRGGGGGGGGGPQSNQVSTTPTTDE